ncbi:MAG: tRNA uridine-5-carboxymethylaminomethyl(34) synthesis GTPase MnmE [Nitrospiraceae bacterium]
MGGALDDTICAIATPVGEGGIGVLRVSGCRAVEAVSGLVRLRSGNSLQTVTSHRLYHADILLVQKDNQPQRRDHKPHDAYTTGGRILDEALVVVMRAPRSYTGEDVAEIQCHGGPLILQTISHALVANGVRLAEPGEFTKRAFLNGRLDLAQAEAVLDTIQAKTATGLKLAQEQLRGVLSTAINRVRESLLDLLAQVEAAIDFSEEDISFVQNEELRAALRRTIALLSDLIERSREGRIIREGAKVVIIGRPNVGKSSLMNALVRSDRAIVTAVPGTTRDVLEEMLNIRGVPVRIFDTAGIRKTDDDIEREGVRRSLIARDQADLVLLMLDGSQCLTSQDYELLACGQDNRRLVVVNKMDLSREIRDGSSSFSNGESMTGAIKISCKTEFGLEELRDQIRSVLVGHGLEAAEGPVVTSLRHQVALERACEALEHALESATAKLSGEFIAMDLRVAADALGEITGTVSTDDILDRIFSRFCIGK